MIDAILIIYVLGSIVTLMCGACNLMNYDLYKRPECGKEGIKLIKNFWRWPWIYYVKIKEIEKELNDEA